MEFQKSRGWRCFGMWTRSIWRTITSQTRRECRDSLRWSSYGWVARVGVESSCRRIRLRRLKRWRRSVHCRISSVCWKRCIWNTRRFMTCRSIEKSAWRCCRRWSSWIRTRRVLWDNAFALWIFFVRIQFYPMWNSSFMFSIYTIWASTQDLMFLYLDFPYFAPLQSISISTHTQNKQFQYTSFLLIFLHLSFNSTFVRSFKCIFFRINAQFPLP